VFQLHVAYSVTMFMEILRMCLKKEFQLHYNNYSNQKRSVMLLYA